jgi:hypothetical protein
LEVAYGREMNIQLSGNSSGEHSCILNVPQTSELNVAPRTSYETINIPKDVLKAMILPTEIDYYLLDQCIH